MSAVPCSKTRCPHFDHDFYGYCLYDSETMRELIGPCPNQDNAIQFSVNPVKGLTENKSNIMAVVLANGTAPTHNANKR